MTKRFIALVVATILLLSQPARADYQGGYAEQYSIRESDLTLADSTTNDVSTSAHGFAPKAPNNTYTFLRGDASWAAPLEKFEYAISDETTALTTGTAKLTWRSPCAMTLTGVRLSAITAPTGATLVVDINEGGVSVLSTKLSLDATEKTSTTAATAAVISDSTIADDAEMTADIDQVGSTIAGVGAKIILYGRCTA